MSNKKILGIVFLLPILAITVLVLFYAFILFFSTISPLQEDGRPVGSNFIDVNPFDGRNYFTLGIEYWGFGEEYSVSPGFFGRTGGDLVSRHKLNIFGWAVWSFLLLAPLLLLVRYIIKKFIL